MLVPTIIMPESRFFNSPDQPIDLQGIPDAAAEQIILKVHPLCNLACNYCYMYELGDTTWQNAPKQFMTPETVDLLASRVAEHADEHTPERIGITFHGGEPLLAPPDYFAMVASALRQNVRLGTLLDFSVQTNGTLLTQNYLDVFAEHRIRVGLSLDGDQEANDRHRRYSHGGSSYERVMRAIDLLRQPQNNHIFANVIAVIDLENDPLETYEALLDTGAKSVDFLLPNGNWDSRPDGKTSASDTPYAEWLKPVFDAWFLRKHNFESIRIKSFDSMINLTAGKKSLMEGFGLEPVREIVVTNDGSIEKLDTLRSSYDGAAQTSMHLRDTSITEVLAQPEFKIRTVGKQALADLCQTCPIVQKCGGGYEPHRYSKANGYDNPTVYCTDMMELFSHVRNRMVERSMGQRQVMNRLLIEANDVAEHLPTSFNEPLVIPWGSGGLRRDVEWQIGS